MGERIESNHRDNGVSETSSREIEALRTPMANLIDRIRPSIERGDYGLVLGIDGSGRVPARIVWEVAKKINKGESSIDLKFIAGSSPAGLSEEDRASKETQLQDYFRGLNLDKSKKIIIIDDTISSGNSLKSICEVLRSRGYKFDVACFDFLDSGLKSIDEIREYIGADSIIISDGNVDSIHNNKNFSGVKKDPKAMWAKRSVEDQKKINQIREEAMRLADEIAAKSNIKTTNNK